VGDGDDHVLAGDQVLVLDVGVAFDDLGAARHGEAVADLDQFLADDGHDRLARGQDLQVALDDGGQLVGLAEDLVAAEAGQAARVSARMARACSSVSRISFGRRSPGARVGDQLDQGQHVARRPVLGHQPLAGLGGSLDERMMWMNSSMLATAMARPTKTWPRSRAL
jgi:hypothetical protein